MKRLLKIAGIIVVLLVVLTVALAILARILITPARVKATVIPIAEKALHRKVTLGEIQIGLTGITLKHLAIAGPNGKRTFISADDLVLRYQLWPLLEKRIIVNEVRLDHPVIHVIRNANGKFNFSDLIAPKPKSKVHVQPAAPPSSSKTGPPINLLVSKVAISGGEVLFEDYTVPFSKPFRYTIKDLTLSADNISLKRAFTFKADALLKGTPLEMSGSVNPGAPSAEVKLRLNPLNITEFLPYYRDRLPGRLDSAMIQADLSLDGNTRQVVSSGTVSVDRINATFNAMADAPLRNAHVSIKYDMAANLKKSKLQIRKLETDINGISLGAKGMVDHYAKDPSVDIVLSIPPQQISDALKAVPPEAIRAVTRMHPTGSIKGDIYFSGPVSRPKTIVNKGDLSLENVAFTASGIRPDITGKVNLRGDMIQASGLGIALGKDKIALGLTVKNFMAKPIVITNNITSDRLNIDALLASMKKGAPTPQAGNKSRPAAKSRPSAAGTGIGPIHLPLTVDGSMAIGQAVYHGLTINHFDAAYHLENNILTIRQMTGEVAGGKFDNSGRLDLAQKGLSYSAKVSLEGVKANPIISAFSPSASNTVLGNLNLTANLNGRGTQLKTIEKKLSGKADVHMTDAELTGTALVKGLANVLNLKNLKSLRFHNMAGKLAVSDGKVKLSSDFEGSRVRMYPKGTINLDGALDMILDLRLAPSLTSGINRNNLAMSLLADDKGWSRLPLKLTGTWHDPKLAVDTSLIGASVEQKAKSAIQKRLTNEIIKHLSPENTSSSDQKQQQSNPTQKILNNAFQKLFGK